MKKLKYKNIFILELIIPLFYIVNQYSLKKISIGSIFLSLYILYFFLTTRRFKIYPSFIFFGLFTMFHDTLKIFLGEFNYFLFLERILYFLFLVTITKNVDEDILYKRWKFISLFVILALFFQAFQVYYLHQKVSMINIFPFLEMGEREFLFRPHSFFREPAAYISWMVPLLCMSLERKEILFSIIISISILLSTSSIGCLMASIVWLYHIYVNNSLKNTIIKIFVLITIIVVLSNLNIFSFTIMKLKNISLHNTSNYVRTIFGICLYVSMPLVYQIFGIPYISVEKYLRSGEVNLQHFNLSKDIYYLGFVNSISNCAIIYGVFGLIIYLYFFYNLSKNIKKRYINFLLICFISIFMQSTYWNALFIMQFSIILGCGLNRNKLKRR